jgi:hypothetical protein
MDHISFLSAGVFQPIHLSKVGSEYHIDVVRYLETDNGLCCYVLMHHKVQKVVAELRPEDFEHLQMKIIK